MREKLIAVTWPALVLWLLILLSALSDGPALLYLFGVSSAFETLQMLPGDIVGGANFLPQSVCAVVLVCKVFVQRGNFFRGVSAAVALGRLGLLFAFLGYSLSTALTLPRLFAGSIEVFGVSSAAYGTSLVQPTFANITQSMYMTLSVATALAFSVVGSRSEFRRHYLIAALLGSLTVIATGILDLAAYDLGLSVLLDPFRTVTYSLLTEADTLGVKRVVGLTSEASSYGSLCVSSLAGLAFLRPCFDQHLRRTVVPLTIGGLMVMAALSTSSGAYIGLCVFAAVFCLNWMIRLGSRSALVREELGSEVFAVVVVAFSLLCVAVMFPRFLDPVSAVVSSTVFDKTSTASFLERSSWTAVGWQAFLATGGLGVGLGSLRVSNWLISILGSTGTFGAGLMFGFILHSLASRSSLRSPQNREWRRGLKCSLLPSLVMSFLIGTTPDIGVGMASIFGLLADDSQDPIQGRHDLSKVASQGQ